MTAPIGPPFDLEIAERLRMTLEHYWDEEGAEDWAPQATTAVGIDADYLRIVDEHPYQLRLGLQWVYRSQDDELVVWMRAHLPGELDPTWATAKALGANSEIDDATFWS